MHPQLESLLEIQDLKAQRRELDQVSTERQFEEEIFHISIADAVAQLDEKIADMEAQLEPSVRNRYRRLAERQWRVVAPVIRGTCYGCFVSIPTAVASEAGRNEELRFCDSCGRFLYVVD